MTANWIGKPVPRKEGPAKVTGERQYIDDMTFDRMIYGGTVRSQVSRAEILDIKFDPSIDWSEFVVVTAQDLNSGLGASNHVALILDDQPVLADRQINHPEEAVVLLAHKDKGMLCKGLKGVEVVTKQKV